ncbi:MAG: hypothetical protein ABI878_05465 [Acidobacteriota bacterium]
MKNDRPVKSIEEISSNLYPHLKITAEEFPRMLVTRKIEDDGADYHGAFLPKTALRITIDLIQRTFRLRRCDIEIDGSFNVPCTQFYERRCLAPCVASLCGKGRYREMVDLVRLFLANRRAEFLAAAYEKVDALAEDLNFEEAAVMRDLIASIESSWEEKRFAIWLDDTVDSYAVDRSESVNIFLVTQRGRRALGRKVFSLHTSDVGKALYNIIDTFYPRHIPKEIRVLDDFEHRVELGQDLSLRFGRKVRIVAIDSEDRRMSTAFALTEALSESEIDAARPQATPAETMEKIQIAFGLSRLPEKIEAFDAAHISEPSFSAAYSVALGGKTASGEYSFEVAAEQSELASLASIAAKRIARDRPDLVVVDGGKPQMNAVLAAIGQLATGAQVIAAVKPKGKHSEISHFLMPEGENVLFDPSNAGHNFLKRLRDDAHFLANQVHRDLRDMAHHYELAAMLPSTNEWARRRLLSNAGSLKKIQEMSERDLEAIFDGETSAGIVENLENYRKGNFTPVLPLIVPLRDSAEGGGAEDIRPLSSKR